MTTKIEGPNAEVDASAAELARANERHTAANAADAAKLDRVADDALTSLDEADVKARTKKASDELSALLMHPVIPTHLAIRIRARAGDMAMASHTLGLIEGVRIADETRLRFSGGAL